jgi:glucose-6-phosphate 1-epimerase
MQTNDLMALNDSFAIKDHITFAQGSVGETVAHINNSFGKATISTYGAQVLSYQPHGQQPVLWCSPESTHSQGKAIRGGIPICWPWFGPHPSDPSLPAHGLVRTAQWQILSAAALNDRSTQIRLRLDNSRLYNINWHAQFDIRCVVTLGTELSVDLILRNPGTTAYTYTGALHSYFAVSDINNISIEGLENTQYIDKVDSNIVKSHPDPIRIINETDRVYFNTSATCIINDPGLQRRIVIEKSGSNSTVVWNPWIAKSQTMADLSPNDYQHFVCVETANAEPDSVTVQPGGEHILKVRINSVQ